MDNVLLMQEVEDFTELADDESDIVFRGRVSSEELIQQSFSVNPEIQNDNMITASV